MKINELSSEPWKPGKQYKVTVTTARINHDSKTGRLSVDVHPQQAEFHIHANHFQDAHNKVKAIMPELHQKFMSHHKPNMKGIHAIGHYSTIHDGGEEKEGPHHEVKYVTESITRPLRDIIS